MGASRPGPEVGTLPRVHLPSGLRVSSCVLAAALQEAMPHLQVAVVDRKTLRQAVFAHSATKAIKNCALREAERWSGAGIRFFCLVRLMIAFSSRVQVWLC